MKELYIFDTKKTKTVEEKTDNGDGTFTIKNVDADEIRKVFLKKLSRRDLEEMSLIHKANYGKAIALGVPTKETLRRTILDGGGIVSHKDYQRGELILIEMNKVKNDLLLTELDSSEAQELKNRLNALDVDLEELQDLDRELYSKTAEAHADDRTTLWAALNFTYWDADKSPVFPGASDEARMNFYYEICDNPDQHKIELEILRKAYNCFYAAILLDSEMVTKEYFDAITSE